jgi:gamma-glutamyltranspeptidase/glutathione hydrolase
MGLLDKDYLKSRFNLYDPTAAIDLTLDDTAPESLIGDPPRGTSIGPPWPKFKFAGLRKIRSGDHLGAIRKYLGKAPVSDTDSVQDTTSHISIVDAYGNALSMTTTNNKSFGAQMEARGMILNNVQANFTRLNSISPGKPANIMESMKRARTSVAPTLVFKPNGKLVLVVGAAGGGAIPDYVAQTILNVLVYGMDPQEAINQAHMSGQAITSNCGGVIGARSEVEAGTPLADLEDDLKDLGHPCARDTTLRSGLTAISIMPNGTLSGAADPRRDGIAMGE